MKKRKLNWRRRKNVDGSWRYDGELVEGGVSLTVASAVQTGDRSRDVYPWEWYLTDHGVARALPDARQTGQTDTLRSSKDQVEWALRR